MATAGPSANVITPLPPTLLPAEWSIADLQTHLGGVPPERIRLYPPPGILDGGNVLPGFRFRLGDLLDKIPRQARS
jgi:hypothetical protein